jgi:hypothetical protein
MNGGGVYNYTYSTTGGQAALTACTVSGNTAGLNGGGVYDYSYSGSGGVSTLINCTLTQNNALGTGGGAIYNYTYSGSGGTSALTNCTISNNSGTNAGGLYNTTFSGTGGNAALTNCIVSGDTGGEIFGAATVTYSDLDGGYVGTGNIDAAPMLGSLADNGGPTETIALLTGSPCFGAGLEDGAPNTDQRGVVRPFSPSMGAYDRERSRFDFNGDGKDDLIWSNSQTGQLAIWDMNGTVISPANTGAIFVTINPVWKIMGVADINADGQPDLLWWDSHTGQMIFWR